jgi:acyl carrier protein
LELQSDVIGILARVLDLGERARGFGPGTHLLGSVPELDSMAVATLITTLEEHFGFVVDDDEIDGSTFATVGSLVAFVQSKLTARNSPSAQG